MTGLLAIIMLAALCFVLMAGFPVIFTLAGTALVFGLLGHVLGLFDASFFGFVANRIYGVMTNEVLIAIPLFVFMGMMLERSKVAEELLETMGRLFGRLPGGLGVSVCLVGALLAASTGVVGATVVTMGLISLPTMLRIGYSPAIVCGVITASGTLGQIIPPSIVLVILGDVIANGYIEAQRNLGNMAPEPVSVADLFAGALFPGLILAGLYIVFVAVMAGFRPQAMPPVPPADSGVVGWWPKMLEVGRVLLPPVVLILAVLGSILVGIATPTEAAAVGAVTATMLGIARLFPACRMQIRFSAACLIGLFVLTALVDLRVGREAISTAQWIGILVALLLSAGLVLGLFEGIVRLVRRGVLQEAARTTTIISAMIFGIIIGAQVFSLVFRGLEGDEVVHAFLSTLPGGVVGAMTFVMALLFVLGFFLDTIEITYIVVPIVAPILFKMGVEPIWLGVMIAVNLQTSFLTPPFGFSLFYLRGVAPPEVTTSALYRGVVPFVALQLLGLLLLAALPGLATWLPKTLFG